MLTFELELPSVSDSSIHEIIDDCCKQLRQMGFDATFGGYGDGVSMHLRIYKDATCYIDRVGKFTAEDVVAIVRITEAAHFQATFSASFCRMLSVGWKVTYEQSVNAIYVERGAGTTPVEFFPTYRDERQMLFQLSSDEVFQQMGANSALFDAVGWEVRLLSDGKHRVKRANSDYCDYIEPQDVNFAKQLISDAREEFANKQPAGQCTGSPSEEDDTI